MKKVKNILHAIWEVSYIFIYFAVPTVIALIIIIFASTKLFPAF